MEASLDSNYLQTPWVTFLSIQCITLPQETKKYEKNTASPLLVFGAALDFVVDFIVLHSLYHIGDDLRNTTDRGCN